MPHPGRPWNPPYQPGPGMQTRAAAELAAGAGLDWVLDDDSKTLRSLFQVHDGTAVPVAVFAPDGDLKLREIPIALQMPDWNHWLPQVHPLDAWGDRFAASEFNRMYAARERGSGSGASRRCGELLCQVAKGPVEVPDPAQDSRCGAMVACAGAVTLRNTAVATGEDVGDFARPRARGGWRTIWSGATWWRPIRLPRR